jgi:hypothetical protein
MRELSHAALMQNVQIPPLPPVLVAKAAALRMHAHELSAENDFCDTCKMVVTEAASILGNLVSIWQTYQAWGV